jgi:SPP1 family predicted phage head-tail adaptor
MKIGAMVHDVLIQQLTDGVDSSGAPQETWSTLTQAWMARPQATGDERFTADQETASSTTTWVMRYVASMDADLVDVQKSRRLLYQGRAYDIVDAKNMDRQAGIVLRTLSHSKVAA